MSRATLLIGGAKYEGWTSVNITRSLEAIAGSFELTVSERFPGEPLSRPIRPGAECRVELDGTPVLTGYVDDVEPRYDKGAHEITVRGRDKTGDLVDCSAEGRAWKNSTLQEIAGDLCAPFGISVAYNVGASKLFKDFTISGGEAVFEALDRAARMRGVLLTSDGLGRLVITRASTEKAGSVLKRGLNILSASGQFSHRDRFSAYTVKGQARGSDNTLGPAVFSQKGEARDTGISRHRPLIVTAEDAGDAADFQTRADWEKNHRYGQSNRVSVTVPGWAHPGGLWRPNVRVKITDDWLGMDTELLIAGVTYRLDAGGTVTELELAPPGAFDVLPLPEKAVKEDL